MSDSMTDIRNVQGGLLNADEAAAWLKVSKNVLYTLPIRKVKFAKQIVRYDVKDLQFFADTHGDTEPLRKKTG